MQVLANALAGYNTARYRAKQGLRAEEREEKKFALEERGLNARIAASEAEAAREERKFASEQAQAQAAQAAVEGMADGPQKENARRLLAIGETDELAKLLNPDPTKYEMIGDDVVGRFAVNPQDPSDIRQIMPGVGRAPSAPVPQFELSGGVRMNKFTGEIERIPGAGTLPPIGQLQAYRDSLPEGDPRREEVQKAIDKANAAPSSGITVGIDEAGNPIMSVGGAGAIQKPPTGYRYKAGSNLQELEPIPGGPGEVASADVAGRMALLPGAREDIKVVKDLLIDPVTKKVNRAAIIAANPPIPFVGALPGQGREIDSRIEAAIDTMIRLRTGAGGSVEEMARLRNIYTPYGGDSDATVKNKIDRLDRDLSSAQEQFSRGKGGMPSPPAGGAPPTDVPLVGQQQPLAFKPDVGTARPTPAATTDDEQRRAQEYQDVFGF